MTRWAHVRTERLWLDVPVDGRGGGAWLVEPLLPLRPAVLGRGYAAEMGRAALDGAHDVAPERPVLAFLLEHDVASRRTAEKLGLRLVWRGPDAGNPDPDAVGLVFLDREPDDLFVVEVSAGEGWDADRFVR